MEHIEGRFVYGDDVYIPDKYLDEVWEYIPGIDHYMVSNYGRVWSEKIRKFRGQSEAGRILGIQQANIFKVLNGERRQTGGWTFEYDERR